MSRINYRIRKLYVILHPLLKRKAHSQRIQFIMRHGPLIQDGVLFFFEPWVQPDVKDKYEGKSIVREFVKEFSKYVQRRLNNV